MTSSAVERLRAAVLTSPGALDAELRAAAFQGGILPEPLRTYAAKVAARAYQATDADVDALRAAGYSEDQIFEATVCVAVGVGLRQLERGLNAIGGGTQA